nr:hypothetical protein [Allomuricauda sp.]
MSFKSTSQNSDAIVGNWKSEDNKYIKFYSVKEGVYYGKINDKKDKYNGKILCEVKYNNQKKSYTGTLRPPETDVTLKTVITIVNSKKMKIVSSKFLISKTVYCTKVNE